MSSEEITIHIMLSVILTIAVLGMVLNIVDIIRQSKNETEYAVQWRYCGKSVWYTSPKYSSMEEAVLTCDRLRANNPMLVLRIVKRKVTKWEEV